ncbi:PQQ-binding-like beta-propeller repeat protein (plasmid) [Alkalihalophilus sp. As8PL]|uniref:PQQ-binding-like beta-propeller repeat protein n=1 Tax=Alkalihalophilus sp. As8PL TaxID=3237103 RepID=A0AB39BMR6_9BACI
MKQLLIFLGTVVLLFTGLNIFASNDKESVNKEQIVPVTARDSDKNNELKEVSELVYQHSLDGSVPTHTPIIVDEFIKGEQHQVLYIVDNGVLQAINHVNGEIIWRVNVEGQVTTSPVYYEGNIILVSEDNLHALNATDGREVWSKSHEQVVDHSPVVVGDTFVIASTNGTVTAFNKEGEVFWKVKVPELKNGLVAWKDSVIAASYEGVVIELDASTGQQVWSTSLEGKILGTPSVYEDSLYIGTSKGVVHAVDLKNKDIQWRSTEFTYANKNGLLNSTIRANGVSTSIASNGNYIAFGTVYEVIYLLNRETGEVISSKNLTPDVTIEDKEMMLADPLLVEDSLFLSNRNAFYAYDKGLNVNFEYDGYVQLPINKNRSMVLTTNKYLYTIK